MFLFPVKVLKQQILPAQYRDVVGDNMINLSVVLQDMASQEHVLASEEFNIASPQLTIKVLLANLYITYIYYYI